MRFRGFVNRTNTSAGHLCPKYIRKNQLIVDSHQLFYFFVVVHCGFVAPWIGAGARLALGGPP